MSDAARACRSELVGARHALHSRTVPSSQDELIALAAREIDGSLLEWYLSRSALERLRAASRSAALLDRMARAAARDR